MSNTKTKVSPPKVGEELYYPRPGKWWYAYKVIGNRGQRAITVSVSKLYKDERTLLHRRKMIPWDEWGKMSLYSYPKEWQAGVDP